MVCVGGLWFVVCGWWFVGGGGGDVCWYFGRQDPCQNFMAFLGTVQEPPTRTTCLKSTGVPPFVTLCLPGL